MSWDGACVATRGVARAALLASAICVAAATAPGVAAAAPGFTAPITYPLPAGATPQQIQVAYASGGTATIAYLQVVSSSPTAQTILHVGVIPPGGTYTEQLQIASTSTSVPAGIALAEAPSGAAVVEYLDYEGTDQASGLATAPISFMASYRAAGAGSWEAPTAIVANAAQGPGIDPQLVPAISSDGTAAAGVGRLDTTIPSPGGGRIDVAVHPAGGAWSSATQISPASRSSEDLLLGFDSAGDLTAAFRLAMGNGRFTLASSRRPATSGIWGSVQDITGSDVTSDVYAPHLAVAPDGSAVIAFQYVHYTAPGTLDATAVTRVGPTGAWTAPADVAPGGSSSAPMAVGISPDDRAYVLYGFEGTSSGQDCVGAVRAQAGATFSAPACVSGANFQPGVSGGVAFLGDDAYLGWSGEPNGGTVGAVDASRWTSGAAQADSATTLDTPGPLVSFESILADQDGSVATFWASGTGASATLRAAAFDAGGPNLQSASVPTQATVGQSVTMSAAFADLWSGLGPDQPAWSFGDGGSATGGSVTHTFAAPGTYQVTVSSSDGLGNQTAQHYSIVVAATAPVIEPSGPGSPLRMTHVGQTAARWAEPGGRSHRHRSVRVGTSFHFTLNQAARVKLTFLRPTAGHKVRHRCRRGRVRHAARCVLMVRVGTIRLPAHTGRNAVAFTGTISQHRLAPGSYAVTITAGSGAAAVSRTLKFRIVAAGR